MSLEKAIRLTFSSKKSSVIQTRDTALILRKEIKKMTKKSLPKNLTLSDLLEGEIEIPEAVSSSVFQAFDPWAVQRKRSCQ